MSNSTVGSRLKKIRKTFGLNQQDFADRIKISRGALANYEVDRNEPLKPIITAICREFGVNEEWLRTGEGQMQSATSREEEIEAMIRSGLKGSNDLKKALIQAICSRTESELEVLEKMLWDIVYNLPEKKMVTNQCPEYKP